MLRSKTIQFSKMFKDAASKLEAFRKLKQWLLEGRRVEHRATPRNNSHKHIDARRLVPPSDDELGQALQSALAEPHWILQVALDGDKSDG